MPWGCSEFLDLAVTEPLGHGFINCDALWCEIHSEQEDTDWTPGNDFHFEWGLAKTLDKIWDVGLVGYCRWQVTDDSGSGSVDDREEAYAIGPEVSVFMPNYGLGVSLRSLWEFENKLGSEGHVTTLMIMKAF